MMLIDRGTPHPRLLTITEIREIMTIRKMMKVVFAKSPEVFIHIKECIGSHDYHTTVT